MQFAVRKKRQFNRRVTIGDLLTERIDNAAAYGFGEGTTMMGVRVGERAIIGANSLVNRDIPPGATAFGSLARIQETHESSVSAAIRKLYSKLRKEIRDK